MYQNSMLCPVLVPPALVQVPQQASSSRLFHLGKDGLNCKAPDSSQGFSAQEMQPLTV